MMHKYAGIMHTRNVGTQFVFSVYIYSSVIYYYRVQIPCNHLFTNAIPVQIFISILYGLIEVDIGVSCRYSFVYLIVQSKTIESRKIIEFLVNDLDKQFQVVL